MLTIKELKERLRAIEIEIDEFQDKCNKLRVSRHRYKKRIALLTELQKIENEDQ